MATADVALEVPAGRRLVGLARPVSNGWLVVLALVWLLPLWLLVSTPMKSTPEYTDKSQWALPTHPLRLLSNLRTAWDSAGARRTIRPEEPRSLDEANRTVVN